MKRVRARVGNNVNNQDILVICCEHTCVRIQCEKW